jgi:hypothetical protein
MEIESWRETGIKKKWDGGNELANGETKRQRHKETKSQNDL